MRSTAELRKQLLASFGEPLAARGVRRSEQTFRKPWEAGKFCVNLSFVRHADDFDVLRDVAVRHDAIEERLNAARSDLGKREQGKTATVGVELGNWTIGRPLRWTVTTQPDIAPVANALFEEFRAGGLSFLERFAQLGELERVLSAEDHTARLICQIEAKRRAVLAIVRELQGGRAA